MSTLGYVIIFSLLGGVVSLIGGVLLISNTRTAEALAKYATPFAGGALLAAVFLDLLKEGIEHNHGSADVVLIAAVIGIILFFLAEGFLRWFHHHHEHDKEMKEDPRAWLVVLGDTIHNLLDGIAIGAAFSISIPTGIVTTIAVAAHEIPQEIGDFGLLLSKGMSRGRVITVNVLSALVTVVGAVLIFMLGSQGNLPIGAILGLSAGFLLYIAMSDIIPAVHQHKSGDRMFSAQAILLILGVVMVGLVTTLSHQYISDSHADETGGHHSHSHEENLHN